jgi:orotate phosphoribosyltransferase
MQDHENFSEEAARPVAILDRLRDSGALLEGHFLLSSGLHSDRYIQCARLLSHPQHAEYVGQALARAMAQRGFTPADLVIGPALGGILAAHEVARALCVRAIFAEREGGALCLRRGFAIAPGERVLVVEDVITTGGSAAETARLVQSLGGRVTGYAAIVERGEGHGLSPLVSLWQVRPQVFAASDCPLCAAGSAPIKPGSRSLPS